MTRRTALIVTALGQTRLAGSSKPPTPVIIDTDAGSDDLLAIAFLLSRPDVQIESITVANGLADVQRGADNICRLLTLANTSHIPVYIGDRKPLEGNRAFPTDWRRASDELPGVRLPPTAGKPKTQPAAEFLARRLSERSSPIRVLALGPLTNIAAALQRTPVLPALRQLVIMGGALHVPGNLSDGGAFKSNNKTAEWNLFIDPLAASLVFSSRAGITLIPLDATAKVPIDLAFLKEFQQRARTSLGKFASEVLESDRPHIEGGYFQAWDPLAAVALVAPQVVTTRPMSITVRQDPPEDGRTVEAVAGKGRLANVAVALDANAVEFKKIFLSAF